MNISEFKGIVAFHDGLTVSDYCNVIPMGTSVIDRLGEKYSCEIGYRHDETVKVAATFVDSLRNIYVATNKGMFYHTVTRQSNGEVTVETYRMVGDFANARFETGTFCESATKPSQVYFCDGEDVYFWNTTRLPFEPDAATPDYARQRRLPFHPVKIPLFKTADAFFVKPSGTENPVRGWFPPVNAENYDMSEKISVSSITWFDNRLVIVESKNNTVWLSDVDPSRYLVPSSLPPIFPCQPTVGENGSVIYNDDFTDTWYSSTASSARLQDVVAFAGQLYFLNTTSIEVWSATGDDTNPIQHNSQNTLYYGGRSPCVVGDTLYLLCRDEIHNDFVAAIGQGGGIQRVSTPEIERRLVNGGHSVKPLAMRDQSMVVVHLDDTMTDGLSVTRSGYWWRYYSGSRRDERSVWTLANIYGRTFNVTNRGNIVELVEDDRTLISGERMLRRLRGAFAQFAGRKIVREVSVVCDTGVHFDPNAERPKMYLRLSFDRGLGFGPYLYRVLGKSGTNDRVMVWRNCGSGNSMLLEFGTSDNVRFQIYQLDVQIT